MILVLLGVVVAHLVAFDREHLFMLANAYTLWIYLPAYPIAVSALLFRAWPLAITAGLIVVAQLSVGRSADDANGPGHRCGPARAARPRREREPSLRQRRTTHRWSRSSVRSTPT